mgnify:CR=1 FL=1
MKRFLILLSAFLLVLGLSGVACAYSINYSYSLEADGNSYTSPYSGVPLRVSILVAPTIGIGMAMLRFLTIQQELLPHHSEKHTPIIPITYLFQKI